MLSLTPEDLNFMTTSSSKAIPGTDSFNYIDLQHVHARLYENHILGYPITINQVSVLWPMD